MVPVGVGGSCACARVCAGGAVFAPGSKARRDMTCKRETTASYWRFISVRLSVFLRMRLTYHSSLVSSALQSEIIAASPSKFARSRTSMHMNVQLVEHITFRLSVSGFAMPSACAAPKLSGVDSVVIVVD